MFMAAHLRQLEAAMQLDKERFENAINQFCFIIRSDPSVSTERCIFELFLPWNEFRCISHASRSNTNIVSSSI